jgi:hypothetical protein
MKPTTRITIFLTGLIGMLTTTGSRSLGGFINMAPVEYMFTATYQL